MHRRTFLAFLLIGSLSGCSALLRGDEPREINVVNDTDSEIEFSVTVERDGSQVFQTRDSLQEDENMVYRGIVDEPGLYTLLISVENGPSGEDSWRVFDPDRWRSINERVAYIKSDSISFAEDTY